MIEIAVGRSLVVHVGPYADTADRDAANVAIAVADPELAAALTSAVAGAITAALAEIGMRKPAGPVPVVRLRSRKRLACVADRLAGAIAIVPVTARNARHLVALIDGIRAAGAAGIQLVWDGADPPRGEVERHVFAALERARATPGEAPVVLAASDEPATALHLLIAHRSPSPSKEPR